MKNDTGESHDQQIKWDARYADSEADVEPPRPAQVLQDFQHLLPQTGVVLELACGLGGNALYLAQKGLQTHAWDISPVAIDRLNRYATHIGVNIQTRVVNISSRPPAPDHYDIIVVSRFLDRALIPAIIAALKTRALVFYQTYIREKAIDTGPGNPAYLLAENELLRLFSELRVLAYREEGRVGNMAEGFRNEAMIVAQKC